jgi:CubicO group peptidase (beta-lactamase class C family)
MYNGAAGLQITSRDMLKIGELVLNKGIFKEQRIVPLSWIDLISSPVISTGNVIPFGHDYGYYWWIGTKNSHTFCFANGWGGQFIVVVPDLEMIIVATNRWKSVGTTVANQQWYETLDLIINRIVPFYN